jgi:outer membrane protein TolC
MLSKSFLWFFVFYAIHSTQVFSQKDENLSLTKAIEIAKQNYPAIKAKAAETQASVTELSTARSNYLPNLVVQAQALNATSNQIRGAFFPNEGMAIPVAGGIKTNGTNSNDMVWSSFATAFVNWKIFNFGKVKSKVDLAKAEISKSQSDFDNEVFQHQIKVCDTYVMAILFEGLVKTQQSNLDRVNALKKVTVAYTQSGLKSGVDSSLVNAEYSKAYLLLLESKRLATEQKIILKELLGISGENNFSLDTSFFLSKTPQNISLETKISKSPILNYYQSLVDYNSAKIKAIKRSELPSISILGATFGRGSGIADKPNPDGGFTYNKTLSGGLAFRAFDYMVGVSTIWNITNSYRNQTEGRKQFFITKEYEEIYNEQKLKLEGELERANLRYNASKEAANQAPIQLRAAQDAYRQSKARYDNGLNTIIELTQTFSILNRSEVDLTVANGNTWRALLSMAAATGNLDLFIQNIK